MKKIISFIVLIFICLYGFSVNPVDPPAKTGDEANPVVLAVPSQNDECSEMMAEVSVTVIITFTDCPDYECEEPFNCALIELCIYDGIELLDCQEYYPDQCEYTFEDLRAHEGDFLFFQLVVTPSGCVSGYNDQGGWTYQVPLGGGTLYPNTTYCEH